MAELADSTGSVISAVLFGALAGCGRAAVRARGLRSNDPRRRQGLEPSLRAFAAGFDRTVADAASSTPPAPPKPASAGKLYPALTPIGDADFDALVADARTTFPASLHGMIAAGMRKVADFQDVRYAREYLDLVAGFQRLERGGDPALTRAAAKYIAVAMAYDDVIRVADLKTRASRFERVRSEVLANPDQLVYTTEFMHPRMEEVLGTLPAALGQWLESKPVTVQGA